MKKLSVLILALIVLFSMSYAGDYSYVGVKKCKMCHKSKKKGEVFGKWEKRGHAKAFETLKKKGEDKNPKCLECHVTGFNAGGYKVGDPKAANFEGVQCESCHGPGSGYKSMKTMKDPALSKSKGLWTITEDTCKKCHNKKSPTFKGFNYKEALKKIDHKYR